LTLTGSIINAINGTGNSNSNTIIGNDANNVLSGLNGDDYLNGGAGSDVLVGGSGNDSLNGGAGIDAFSFDNTTSFANLGVDSIADFTSGTDKIYLSRSVFGLATGVNNTISSSEFAVVTDSTAAGFSTAAIVYNSSLGELYYNQNGAASGFGSGGLFADFTTYLNTNPTLAQSDVFVIA
jgi:Ca2+-binding RTX toxin-like protein